MGKARVVLFRFLLLLDDDKVCTLLKQSDAQTILRPPYTEN